MKLIYKLVLVISLCWDLTSLRASPRDDLVSPSQQTRDVAARILRETYSPPARTNWDELVHALAIGMKESLVDGLIQSSNVLVAGSEVGPGFKIYRLDDLWVLLCTFTNSVPGKSNGGLSIVTLEERMNSVWVAPPTNFTGVWITYWVNGQPNERFEYREGRYEGLLTSFYNDGSKAVVSSYHNGIADGEETAFYPSGRIKHKGQYKSGRSVGNWIWYREDGSVESEKDYDNLKGLKQASTVRGQS